MPRVHALALAAALAAPMASAQGLSNEDLYFIAIKGGASGEAIAMIAFGTYEDKTYITEAPGFIAQRCAESAAEEAAEQGAAAGPAFEEACVSSAMATYDYHVSLIKG